MFTRAYKNYALAVLTAVYAINLVDRGLMIVLLEPIKRDLALSDTQLGLVTGIAFGLFYATLGVPIARWADRGDRVRITSLAIGLWGLTVMACLSVTNFAQLAMARVAAAIGEAGCKPPTYSLVGDYFPEPRERIGAMSVYMSASAIATLASFSAAGWLNDQYGWRLTFFIAGIPGLLLALLVALTIREPRSLAPLTTEAATSRVAMMDVFKVLWTSRTCWHLVAAQILLLTLGSGLGPWYAAFMMRMHDMGTTELGAALGLIFGLSSMVGLLIGGYVASRGWAGDECSQLRIAGIAMACVIFFLLIFLLSNGKYVALAALIPQMLLMSVFLPSVYALMQRLVPDSMRATALAIVMLLGNFIGMGLGPLIVGASSDALAPIYGKDSLRYAMIGCSTVAIWIGFHLWRASRFVTRDLECAEAARAGVMPVSAEVDVRIASEARP